MGASGFDHNQLHSDEAPPIRAVAAEVWPEAAWDLTAWLLRWNSGWAPNVSSRRSVDVGEQGKMNNLDFGRCALGICAAAAMLAGCGGHAGSGVVPINVAPDSLPYHQTFHYAGKKQSFKVPAGVTQLKVVARGAEGAIGSRDTGPIAYGGRVHAVIPVTPGETLVVYVGGDASGSIGGYNGGGAGTSNSIYIKSYGGGGATDVREGGNSLPDRILVAGGGGGQGGADNARHGLGGEGGGSAAGNGTHGWGGRTEYRRLHVYGMGGTGGTQDGGGIGGRAGYGGYGSGDRGASGSLGMGGAGGQGQFGGGGGAGGGYFGGGGGGGGGWDYGDYEGGGGGGGGGSSYAESSASNVRFWRGWKQSAHNGLVVFSW
jgi:hypothetical protein